MKKLLCMLLTVLVLLGSFGTVLANDGSNDAKILNTLGIMMGTGDGFELDREITRAEATALLYRMHPSTTGAMGLPQPIFEDVDGWAYKYITYAKIIGLVDGISDKLFAPDRIVTGREFVKMTLSLLGFDDVTVENAYDKGVELLLILNKPIGDIVSENKPITRGAAAEICVTALSTPMSDGSGVLYKKLCQTGKWKESDFDILGNGSPSFEETQSATFADKLNAQMPKDKNYMFSPISIKMALGLALLGTEYESETQKEILAALGESSVDELASEAKAIIEKYSKSEILNLKFANSVWLNESQALQNFTDDYKNAVLDYYGAAAEKVNDSNAVKLINDWVFENTNGKIDSIVSDSDFWAMLVNAVYFKGRWQNDFMPGATKKDAFIGRDGTVSQIDFMNDMRYMNYSEDGNIKIGELPYLTREDVFDENGDYIDSKILDYNVSMYVLQSNGDFDAESVIKNANLKNTYVKFSMPKFEFDFETDLTDTLKSFGVSRAFMQNAQFDKMFGNGSKNWLTDVKHKTYIKVDEQGTEAAAVTGVGVGGTSLPPEPIEFRLDSPFTFVIYEKTAGEVLFIGEFSYAK